MDQREIIEYYSRDDIADAMLKAARDREVAGVFQNGSFGPRPNVLLYRNDITSLVKSGIVEFHSSLERWSQPMLLNSTNYGSLRIGWDLILDLDCDFFEHGKIAAQCFIWALKKHGISGISIKFTGGTGFHIGIPWESMPKTVNFTNSSAMYPDLARNVCLYLKEYTQERLESELLRKYSPSYLAKKLGVDLEKITTDTGIDPFKIVEVDPVLISPRHLFRMPYSLNQKSFLVSLPLRPEDLDSFMPEHARPDKIRSITGFLEPGEDEESSALIMEAMDWHEKRKKEISENRPDRIEYKRKIEPQLFPPCMQLISSGLQDGRKRALFSMLNFLKSVKWNDNDIEQFVTEWNQKNSPPLQDSYMRSHLRYHKSRDPAPPANCLNEAYYPSMGVCKPDMVCTAGTGKIKIKNPVNYPFVKLKRMKDRKTPARRKGKAEARRI